MHLKTILCVMAALVLVLGTQAGAELINFSAFPGDAQPMDDDVITLSEGALAGIEVTFSTPGWYSYEELLQGAAIEETWDPVNEVWLEEVVPGYVFFSSPVIVPSLKIRPAWAEDASDDAVSGYLGDTQKWGPVARDTELDDGDWQEVTAGAGIPIDTLMFDVSYVDSELDDITVDPIPEPTTLSLLAVAGCLLLLRRRRR